MQLTQFSTMINAATTSKCISVLKLYICRNTEKILIE